MKTLAFAPLTGSACRIFASPGPRIMLDKPDDAGQSAFLTAFEQFQKTTLEKLEKAAGDSGAVREQIAQLEQEIAKRGKGGLASAPRESWGEQFVADEKVKSELENLREGYARRKAGSVSLTLKAAGTMVSGAGSIDAVPVARENMIDPLPRRAFVVRDLLRVVTIETGSVEFPRVKAREGGAGMVAEGGLKPESDIEIELVTTTARVIAHHAKASRQVLDDVPMLRDTIDGELLDGLREKEDEQLLSGDGTGQNLYGLIPQATAFGAPVDIDGGVSSIIDVVGLALLQSALAEYPATGIVMHPSDWLRVRLLKDANGNYLLGPPGADVRPVLFGKPVVETKGITAGKFLIGDFKKAATIFDRWQPRVELGFVNDDFVRNLVTLLAEERLALGMKRAEALIYGDFNATLNG